jgi:hypothetical protein
VDVEVDQPGTDGLPGRIDRPRRLVRWKLGRDGGDAAVLDRDLGGPVEAARGVEPGRR